MEYFQGILEALQTIASKVGQPSITEWALAIFAALSAIISFVAVMISKSHAVAAKESAIASKVSAENAKIVVEIEKEKMELQKNEYYRKYGPCISVHLSGSNLKGAIEVGPEFQNLGPSRAVVLSYKIDEYDLSNQVKDVVIAQKSPHESCGRSGRMKSLSEIYGEGLSGSICKSVTESKGAIVRFTFNAPSIEKKIVIKDRLIERETDGYWHLVDNPEIRYEDLTDNEPI
jgi:hypothetical protein